MAAEYMRWHGRTEDVSALKKAMKGERDPYCIASMEAAIRAIARRSELFGRGGDNADKVQWPTEPAKAYEAGVDLLSRNRSRTARAAVVGMLRTIEPFEPLYYYGDRSCRLTEDMQARNRARLALLGKAFGYWGPHENSSHRAKAAASSRPSEGIRSARTLMPPVREYFNPKRDSFGKFTTGPKGPFAGKRHVGDDVAWHRPQSTVVSIGRGVVKRASAGVPSWGGLVIIEHVDKTGKPFCSLYAHLGPLVCVRAGRRVRRGQKIGTVGRQYTWSNGGYGAHLHFGIHKGAFTAAGGWITGYLSPKEFKDGGHGWVNPQPFIFARLK